MREESALDVDAAHLGSVAILRVSGHLDARSTTQLRAAVDEALARGADVLVIDLLDLHLADEAPHALTHVAATISAAGAQLHVIGDSRAVGSAPLFRMCHRLPMRDVSGRRGESGSG
jgi:anti-anti-sigma regulatory factor